MNAYEKKLTEQAEQIGMELTGAQTAQFICYMELLLEWNTHTNLTAIKQPEEVLEKHFIDSLLLCCALEIPKNAKVIDVGSGAGFPGVPLKIIRPDIQLTALDSANKRLAFLKALGESLELHVELLHARAEEAARKTVYREKFDLATARAVAAMPVLSEYCVPFVKKGGYFAALKGALAQQEAKDGGNAAEKLGCAKAEIFTANLPSGDHRGIILLRKQQNTPPHYPRHGGTIQKKPL